MRRVPADEVVRSVEAGELTLDLAACPSGVDANALGGALLAILREGFPGPRVEGGGTEHLTLASMVRHGRDWRVTFRVRATYGGGPWRTFRIQAMATLDDTLRPVEWEVSYQYGVRHRASPTVSGRGDP